jgi:hypothetical protein
MTDAHAAERLREMDDLLDLRSRLQVAVARRDAAQPGSSAWRTAEAEIEALTRQVWQADERPREPPLETS